MSGEPLKRATREGRCLMTTIEFPEQFELLGQTWHVSKWMKEAEPRTFGTGFGTELYGSEATPFPLYEIKEYCHIHGKISHEKAFEIFKKWGYKTFPIGTVESDRVKWGYLKGSKEHGYRITDLCRAYLYFFRVWRRVKFEEEIANHA
jgi:hypothetical protein